LLQCSFSLATFDVHAQYVVDLGFVSSPPLREALANKIWFLPNQANIEHGADYQRS